MSHSDSTLSGGTGRLHSPEIEALLAIAETLGSSHNLSETFQQIMEILASRLGMERGTLTLLDPRTKELIIRVAHGLTEEEIKRGKYKIGEGITGKVVETGGPLIVPSIGKEPLFLDRTGARKNIDRDKIAFLCVPLKLENEVIGVLSADKVRSSTDTLESDMRLLTIIASIVAQAVRVHGAIAEIIALKERTDRILAGMPNGVLVLDPTGQALSVNPAAERIFGFKRDEAVGKHYINLFADQKSILNVIDRVYDDPNAAASFEAHIFGSSGHPMPVAVSWSILGEDPVEAIVVNIQDLTEVKRLERQMRRSQRLAALGLMAAGVAHEVRNPLAGIRGASQLLARETSRNRKLADFLSVIVREVDRLDRTVEQLLDLARPVKADMAPTSVTDVVKRALTLLKPEVDRSRVRVVKKMPAETRQIMADAAQLTQVFLNLFLNALQAMSDGGMLRVTVREDAGFNNSGPAFVIVEVNDTGCGMSPQVLEQLFMPFFTTRENGTGLGLAISHRIVEEHGGAIDVVSEEGTGTTFIVSFPAL
ncbi:MAG: GAF domain-containing protein [Candidatus Abyssobacteria bacterium SURF_17]|uniref:histidine kinase n=1 Tax=Candidatus Abyssobacteria bacterium SURF_17 TaxID=2093361 RepID=A0A419ET89_9BACT|nr:MAG: GAF domain-containing protein [Candidatus Abyssubacteria bacterium SURF_17]